MKYLMTGKTTYTILSGKGRRKKYIYKETKKLTAKSISQLLLLKPQLEDGVTTIFAKGKTMKYL